jgi:dihydroflavonol-4-reductase
VIHVASPTLSGAPKHEDELIRPAVESTRNIINACLKNTVKRLVFTSSCMTVLVRSDGKIPNEDDWSEEQLIKSYPKGKFLAEKFFWAEADKHGDELEFVSVLPSMVIGPAFTKHGINS